LLLLSLRWGLSAGVVFWFVLDVLVVLVVLLLCAASVWCCPARYGLLAGDGHVSLLYISIPFQACISSSPHFHRDKVHHQSMACRCCFTFTANVDFHCIYHLQYCRGGSHDAQTSMAHHGSSRENRTSIQPPGQARLGSLRPAGSKPREPLWWLVLLTICCSSSDCLAWSAGSIGLRRGLAALRDTLLC